MRHSEIIAQDRGLLSEIAHKRRIEEHAAMRPADYDGIVESIARTQQEFAFSPADGSSIELSSSGRRFAMKRLVPRGEGERATDAADLLQVLLDRPGTWTEPAPNSRFQSKYRDILAMTVSACQKMGIAVPMDSRIVHDAIREAGTTPEKLGLPPLLDIGRAGAEPRLSEAMREEMYRYGPIPVRRRSDVVMERGTLVQQERAITGDVLPSLQSRGYVTLPSCERTM
jgi:hypothetical protein